MLFNDLLANTSKSIPIQKYVKDPQINVAASFLHLRTSTLTNAFRTTTQDTL